MLNEGTVLRREEASWNNGINWALGEGKRSHRRCLKLRSSELELRDLGAGRLPKGESRERNEE